MADHLLLSLAAGLVAVLVAAGATPVVLNLALRVGAVDVPSERRVHKGAIPRMGGVAIFLGVAAALALVLATGWVELGPLLRRPALGFAAGAVVMFLTGVVDDIRSLGAKKKLSLQVLAAVLAWAGGARIYETVNIPGLGPIAIGTGLSLVCTLLWILAFTNAINLIDGLDGLAGGVVFFAALTNIVVAVVTDNATAAAFNAALAGGVLGFLFFNFNPAKIFMGDTGSLFLGYAISAGALLSSRQKESTLASLLVPIIALGVPLTDTILAMLRRVVARRSIFSADRQHIHHRLLALGLTHRRAVLVLYGTTVVLCSFAVLVSFGQDWEVGLATLGAVTVLGVVVRFARHFERLLPSSMAPPPISRQGNALGRELPELFHSLQTTSSKSEVFETLAKSFLSAGAERIVLSVDGRAFERTASFSGRREGSPMCATTRIELGSERSADLSVWYLVEDSEASREVRFATHLVGTFLRSEWSRLELESPQE